MRAPWRIRWPNALPGGLPIPGAPPLAGLLAALLAVLLAACSAGELAPGEPLRPQAGSGLAVLSLTRSGWRDFDLFVEVKGPGQWVGRPIVLRAQADARDWSGGSAWKTTPADAPEGRLVVLHLAPGTYRIERWNGDSRRDGFYGNGYWMYSEPLDLSFTVEPGGFTYLGDLHFDLPPMPNWLANLSSATYRIEIKDQRERDLALLRSKYPRAEAGTPRSELIRFAQAGAPLRYHIFNYTDSDAVFPFP